MELDREYLNKILLFLLDAVVVLTLVGVFFYHDMFYHPYGLIGLGIYAYILMIWIRKGHGLKLIK